MRIFPLIVALLLMVLPCAAEEPDKAETVDIPLDQIWSLSMPETTLIRMALRDFPRGGPARASLSDIGLYLGWLSEKQQCGSAFLVAGHGSKALLNAVKVLSDSEMERDEYLLNSPISAVFFAHASKPPVYIDRVTLLGSRLDIYYRLKQYHTSFRNLHLPPSFALIPLPPISSTKLTIHIHDAPDATGYDRQRISRSSGPMKGILSLTLPNHPPEGKSQ